MPLTPTHNRAFAMSAKKDKNTPQPKRIRYGELEHWLGRHYGDMVDKAGGVQPHGTDEDILQAMDMAAYNNRMQIAVRKLQNPQQT
jgi:hypothetical protein